MFLTALLVVSPVASFLALGAYGTPSVLYTALFFWSWALKNRIVGPLKQDLGVFTFGMVSSPANPVRVTLLTFTGVRTQIMAAELFSPNLVLKGVASLLVSLQFGAVAQRTCKAPAKKVSLLPPRR